MRWVITLASVSVTLLLVSAAATAGDWPKGYVVHENSESPDHKFGLVVPAGFESEDADEGSEASDDANYLANLETHALLGKIAGANHVENQRHGNLNVIWSADSKTCVVNQEARFGFITISVLQLKGTGFQQTDLGRHIEKALVAAAGDEGTGNAWLRFAPNNKLLVRALYYTGNPKGMIVGELDGRDKNRKIARFAGTFDLISKKWSASEAHKTNHWDALYVIYDEPNPSEDKTPERLDEDMNEVYESLRSVLPSGRFAKVHQEQVAWLKERDAAKSVEEKSKLTEERTRTLRAVVWSQ
jgi:Lysozyme inhibitor LprI